MPAVATGPASSSITLSLAWYLYPSHDVVCSWHYNALRTLHSFSGENGNDIQVSVRFIIGLVIGLGSYHMTVVTVQQLEQCSILILNKDSDIPTEPLVSCTFLSISCPHQTSAQMTSISSIVADLPIIPANQSCFDKVERYEAYMRRDGHHSGYATLYATVTKKMNSFKVGHDKTVALANENFILTGT
jgi:hypothetical protein